MTTVWFWPRQVSLEYEAYFLPIEGEPASVFRQALARNQRSWRCFFALDDEGGLVLRGRLAAVEVTMENLDLVLPRPGSEGRRLGRMIRAAIQVGARVLPA